MKKILLAISILIFFSCKRVVDFTQDIYNRSEFSSTKSKSDQIIIKLYSPKPETAEKVYDTFQIKKVYNITGKKQIENFDNLFKNAERTQYCCCPKTNYSIAFLKNKKVLDTYFVDTIEFKNNVRIFEKRWQYSFIIEKQKWRKYLHEMNN